MASYFHKAMAKGTRRAGYRASKPPKLADKDKNHFWTHAHGQQAEAGRSPTLTAVWTQLQHEMLIEMVTLRRCLKWKLSTEACTEYCVA